jgi:hypothetical protein
MRLILRRWHPASPQGGEHVTDRIKRAVIRSGVIFVSRHRILVGREDGQPQILADGRKVVRKTGAPAKDAAARVVEMGIGHASTRRPASAKPEPEVAAVTRANYWG